MNLLDWAHGQAIDKASVRRGTKFVPPVKRETRDRNEFIPTVDYRLMAGHQLADRVWKNGKLLITPQHPKWSTLSVDAQNRILAQL